MPPFEFLGPYRIGETLGRGGMGTVFRAVDEKTKQPVAVKLIAAHVADDLRFRRRFDAEVESLLRLRHEGIVRLIGYGEEEGQLFYSMELVEGESLQARIKRLRKIDWRATLDIAIQVCLALKHAHDIGVIHRDLKPANLVLTQNDQVKLVDFGIAKIFGAGNQTLAGSLLGTADYMAPEQASGAGITVRTDLYAIGGLMYTMLTGRPPFGGKSTTAVIDSLIRDRPLPLDIINPELPEALVELVHQLLEKDPADRPPTALAVMNRLKALRVGLERSQTSHLNGSPTEIEREDASTSDTDAIGMKGGRNGRQDEPTLVRRSRNNETEAREGSVASEGEVDLRHANARTEVSETRRGKTIPPVSGRREEASSKTSFQKVGDKDSLPTLFSVGPEERNKWLHWIVVAGMIVVLAGTSIAVVRALRPPSADQLYLAAIQQKDAGARVSFLHRFPNDPRVTEVRDALTLERIRAAVKRLTAQAALGVKPLHAAEDGFVVAMQTREQSPQEARQRLKYWLDAFDNQTNRGNANLTPLIELATFEVERLARADQGELVDSRVADLLKEIDTAERLPNALEKRTRLEGIIHSYHDQPWATPAVERARELVSKSK